MAGETNQVYSSQDEATRVACPRLATSEGITTTGADRAIVTARDKMAACKNVLEWSAVYADLQYAAVKPVVQSIVIRESQKRTAKPVVPSIIIRERQNPCVGIYR
jgi:hypothetical protein